jgi:hypothetical protein
MGLFLFEPPCTSNPHILYTYRVESVYTKFSSLFLSHVIHLLSLFIRPCFSPNFSHHYYYVLLTFPLIEFSLWQLFVDTLHSIMLILTNLHMCTHRLVFDGNKQRIYG